jgi:hypothetical protein
MPIRDVAQVASSAKVDWDLVAERTHHWRLAAVVRYALDLASGTLDASIPEDAKAVLAIRPRPREMRAMAAYTTDRRKRGGTAISTLRAIPSLRGKMAYVRALLFPNRDFLEARQPNLRPSYLRRLAIPVRWLTGRRRRIS